MLSWAKWRLAAAVNTIADLLRFPYVNQGYRSEGKEGIGPQAHAYSGHSAFGDWLTQTVAYHH